MIMTEHQINNSLESLTNLLYLMQLSESIVEVKSYVGSAQKELARVIEIAVYEPRSQINV